MAILALNVKMTVPLVAAAEFSERNYPEKCSREVWGPSETVVFDVVFDKFGALLELFWPILGLLLQRT